MLNGSDRTQAVYAAIAAQAGFDALNDAEKAKVKAQLQMVYGADLGYIVNNAVIQPGTLQNPAGQPVSTPTGPGATSAPAALTGTGLVR